MICKADFSHSVDYLFTFCVCVCDVLWSINVLHFQVQFIYFFPVLLMLLVSYPKVTWNPKPLKIYSHFFFFLRTVALFLTFTPFISFELIFVYGARRSFTSFFCMWFFICCSAICWGNYSFIIGWPWHRCQKTSWPWLHGFISGHNSIPSVFLSVLMPAPHCFDYSCSKFWNGEVWFLLLFPGPLSSKLLWLFQVTYNTCEFWNLSISTKKSAGILDKDCRLVFWRIIVIFFISLLPS